MRFYLCHLRHYNYLLYRYHNFIAWSNWWLRVTTISVKCFYNNISFLWHHEKFWMDEFPYLIPLFLETNIIWNDITINNRTTEYIFQDFFVVLFVLRIYPAWNKTSFLGLEEPRITPEPGRASPKGHDSTFFTSFCWIIKDLLTFRCEIWEFNVQHFSFFLLSPLFGNYYSQVFLLLF